MSYQFIMENHKLEPDEMEKLEFIKAMKKTLSMVQRPQGHLGSLPEMMRGTALDTFEQQLVQKIVTRVGLKDQSPSAILDPAGILHTCYVGVGLDIAS